MSEGNIIKTKEQAVENLSYDYPSYTNFQAIPIWSDGPFKFFFDQRAIEPNSKWIFLCSM